MQHSERVKILFTCGYVAKIATTISAKTQEDRFILARRLNLPGKTCLLSFGCARARSNLRVFAFAFSVLINVTEMFRVVSCEIKITIYISLVQKNTNTQESLSLSLVV